MDRSGRHGHDGNTIGQDAILQCFPEHDLVVAVAGNGCSNVTCSGRW